jgi:hypothetical protein
MSGLVIELLTVFGECLKLGRATVGVRSAIDQDAMESVSLEHLDDLRDRQSGQPGSPFMGGSPEVIAVREV